MDYQKPASFGMENSDISNKSSSASSFKTIKINRNFTPSFSKRSNDIRREDSLRVVSDQHWDVYSKKTELSSKSTKYTNQPTLTLVLATSTSIQIIPLKESENSQTLTCKVDSANNKKDHTFILPFFVKMNFLTSPTSNTPLLKSGAPTAAYHQSQSEPLNAINDNSLVTSPSPPSIL